MDAIRVAKVDNVVVNYPVPITTTDPSPSTRRRTGTLHLTPHHLIFSPIPTLPAHAETDNELWIPYPIIALCTRLPRTPPSKLWPLSIRTRTFETYIFLFEEEREGGAEDVWLSVKDCAVASSVDQLYAFFYTLPPPTSSKRATAPTPAPLTASTSSIAPLPSFDDLPQSTLPKTPPSGWTSYNPRQEFARQGVGSRTKAWRFTDINRDYSFCSTYPAKMVVPARISDTLLGYAVKYRSKGRIPALSYLHWANHASITRCSQPMVGLKNSRSAQDERLIECIFTSHISPETAYAPTNAMSPVSTSQSLPNVYGATSTNLIIDARPTTNAMANVAKGAGTENMENYKSSKKAYLGIDNIHVMRNSLNTLVEALPDASDPTGSVDRNLLKKSNWLKHISGLLDGSLIIVKNIHINSSHVLIHCSDGWDRTAQLSAISQICLDPFYRTFEGLKVLIEKDWLSFGHKFLDRSGHLSSEKLFTVTANPTNGEEDSDDEFTGASKAAQAFLASFQKQFTSNSHQKEISPVFHQFLDCLYQVHRQFPNRFEWNEDYLIDLHYHLYSCQFGTFLFNCERDRRVQGTNGKAYVDRTVSIWDYLDSSDERHKYINDEYKPELDDRESREQNADLGVLMPDPKDVKFWFKLFKRSDEEMNGSLVVVSSQTQGVEFLGPVGAGQVDPVSSEGVLEGLAKKVEVNGDLPYKPRTKGVVGPASSSSAPDLSINGLSKYGKDTFRPFLSTSSAFSLQTQAPSTSPNPPPNLSSGPLPRLSRSPNPPSQSSSSGSWGWSQLSSGAFTALQGAATQIKSMSQEVVEKMTEVVPVEREGEMWGKNERYEPGTGIGEGRAGGGGVPPGRNGMTRIPSESNPWGGESGLPSTSFGATSTSKALPAPVLAPVLEQPTPTRQPSWTNNPWSNPPPPPVPTKDPKLDDEDDTRPSLSSLSLMDTPRPGVKREKTLDKEMIDAALGGDQKAWDPLGAL